MKSRRSSVQRIKRIISTACLEDSKEPHHPFHGPLHANAHEHLRPYAEPPQTMSQLSVLICSGVQSLLSELRVLALNRNRAGSLSYCISLLIYTLQDLKGELQDVPEVTRAEAVRGKSLRPCMLQG